MNEELKGKKKLKMECSAKRPAFAYQSIVSYLVNPRRPCRRMLCLHRTGAGKTRTIVNVLDNFYQDPRSKLLLFPNNNVRQNFYSELVSFPSRYRVFLEKRMGKRKLALLEKRAELTDPREKREAKKVLDEAEDVLAMKGELSKAGERGQLKAPLRALTYAQAGGSTTFPRGGGDPTNPLLRRRVDAKRRDARGRLRSPFDDTIVLGDEFHNLVAEVGNSANRAKIARLRDALTFARWCVLVGFTATPIVADPADGRAITAVIKGGSGRGGTDEGYISWFNELSSRIYPKVSPPISELPKVVEVALKGVDLKLPMNLSAYAKKQEKLGGPWAETEKLMAMCNGASALHHLRKNAAVMEEWGARNFEKYATKLDRIANDIARSDKKTLVLLRKNGASGVELSSSPMC